MDVDEKRVVARSHAGTLTDQQLRGFDWNQPRLDAKVIAELYQLGHITAASDTLAAVKNWELILPLVIAELKRGEQSASAAELRTLGIIRAYVSAYGGDIFAAPTLHQVVREYAQMAGEQQPRGASEPGWLKDLQERNKIPRRQTFVNVLNRYKATIRKDPSRRPPKIIRNR